MRPAQRPAVLDTARKRRRALLLVVAAATLLRLAYVAEVGGLVVKQENQILNPAPFFNLPQPA